MLYRTYLPAQIVETLLEHRLTDGDTVFSAPWVNGREKGFTFSALHNFDTYVYVAECRNSDQLTVTKSHSCEWGAVTDAEYKAREFYPPGSYEQVADRVLKILRAKEDA